MAFTLSRSRRRTHTRPATETIGGRTDMVAARTETVAGRVYERPVGAAFTGLVALLAGAWGALAGYVGPYFGFRPTALHVWTANWQNGLLHLLPGAVAAAAGIMLMMMGPARRAVRGGAFTLPALMLLGAGAWFVIGPVAWPTFRSGMPFVTGVSALRNLLNVACSSYGPGLLIMALGGMAWKAAAVPPIAVEDPYTPAEAGTAGPATTTATTRTTAVPATGGGEPAMSTARSSGPVPTARGEGAAGPGEGPVTERP